ENSTYDLLTEDLRQAGDSKVVVFVLIANRDASVLRYTPLGDVHLRHDFEARDERRLDVLRHRHRLMENTVHAIADSKPAAIRLDMDIGSAFLDRLLNNRIGHADDRR